MNRKIFLLALCFVIVSVPMLFAGQGTLNPARPIPVESVSEEPVTDIAPGKTTPFVSTPFFTARGETLKYDDGTFNNGLGLTGAGTAPTPDETFGFATYFVLSDFGITDPRKVGTILLQFAQLNGTDYRLYVWSNSGATPMPNSHGTHLYVDMAVPQPAPDVWQEIDLSALNIVLPDTLWIGVVYNWLATSLPDWFLSMNTLLTDNHTYINYSTGGPAAWVSCGSIGYGYPYGVRVVVEEVAAAPFWDFETGWQGWTHTNGLTFPNAWDVLSSGYKPTWTPPDAGDSTMWIDSDAAGSGVLVQDTALSPVVVPPTYMSWLKYGLGHNNLGDWVDVGLKYFDGAVWNIVTLKTYTVDFGPAWDSIDVFAYAGYDSVQVFFYYEGEYDWYAGFDNVELKPPVGHDVGCIAVTSPPGGGVTSGDYDVIGQIHNFGGSTETFDVTAHVFDTTAGAWTLIFDQTATLTDFPVGGDSLVNFGLVTFAFDSYYYTEIFTELADDNPGNDTSFVYSWTALVPGDVIFELDAEAITGDVRLLGVEFDGEYFYCTGASDYTQTWVYVIDTAGTLISSDMQPAHSTGWGWRDIAWDGVYVGPDRIDTLYSSVDGNVDKWGYDFVGDSLIYHGFFDGPALPNRALAYDEDDNWFFTATFRNPCYKFDKTNPNIMQVPNTYAMYGAAYDNGYPVVDGPWVWWHSQDDPGTGFDLQIEQMEPIGMTWTGVILAPVVTMSASGTAGGLSYWSDFRGMDVLFGMNQGTPDHIYGVFLRWTQVGVEKQPVGETPLVFGLNKIAPNPVKDGATVTYTTTKRGPVSLKVYDSAGRLIRTLINSKNESAGYKTVYWDGTDDNHRSVAAGVYFYRLTAENKTASDKMIVVR